MESNWHMEVVEVGLGGGPIRVAARLIAGLPPILGTHAISTGNGSWTLVTIATVGDGIVITPRAGPFAYRTIKLLLQPDH